LGRGRHRGSLRGRRRRRRTRPGGEGAGGRGGAGLGSTGGGGAVWASLVCGPGGRAAGGWGWSGCRRSRRNSSRSFMGSSRIFARMADRREPPSDEHHGMTSTPDTDRYQSSIGHAPQSRLRSCRANPAGPSPGWPRPPGLGHHQPGCDTANICKLERCRAVHRDRHRGGKDSSPQNSTSEDVAEAGCSEFTVPPAGR
jgi:hypothetical protein